MTEENSAGSLRKILAVAACLLIALGGLAGWYWLKRHMGVTWLEVSLFFMPLVIGVAIGCAARWCNPEGSFGVAAVAGMLTLLVGLAGGALQHKVDVDVRLHQYAAATYDETLEYAKATIPLQADDEQLRHYMQSNQVAAVGELADRTPGDGLEDYWSTRNMIHFNWIAARQIGVYGQGGRDRTLLEASQVLAGNFFMDDVLRSMAKEPVTDENLSRFRQEELPFLKKLQDRRITRDDFEMELSDAVRAGLRWNLMIFRGIGPLIGFCTFAGMICAHRLAGREKAEIDEP